MISASLLTLVSLSTVSIFAVATATADVLVAYGMSLDEFNDIRMSESEADFGGVATTDELWSEALLFEYEIAMNHSQDKALTSMGYHPYVICNYAPETGEQRAGMVNDAFQNTPGVDVSHFFFEGIGELNADERSCGLVRTFNDTIPKVYAANYSDATMWMKTNPLNPSMKMVNGTVEAIQSRMDGQTDVGMISVSNNDENGYIKRSTLEFSNVLCPGVINFNGTLVPGEEISQAAKDFVTENGGQTVRDSSYFYHKVNDEGSNYTERMKLWSDAISFVVNLTDPIDGRNPCLDKVIGETLTFEVFPLGGTGVLGVFSSVSEEEGYTIAEAHNMTKDDVDQCIWYTLYAIALNPMVCSVEVRARPQTLCPDLTSDLSKCPPSPPSSGRAVQISWMNIVIVSVTITALSFRVMY